MTDAELDATLAALTAADADPRLADRVVRAIEAPPGASRAGVWPALAALAAAALVLLAAGIGWRGMRPAALPDAPGAPRPVVAAIETGRGLPPEDVVVIRRASVPARHLPRDEASWPSRLPALERPAPLVIERIDRGLIHAPRLSVEPLTIAQLEIASLER